MWLSERHAHTYTMAKENFVCDIQKKKNYELVFYLNVAYRNIMIWQQLYLVGNVLLRNFISIIFFMDITQKQQYNAEHYVDKYLAKLK